MSREGKAFFVLCCYLVFYATFLLSHFYEVRHDFKTGKRWLGPEMISASNPDRILPAEAKEAQRIGLDIERKGVASCRGEE